MAWTIEFDPAAAKELDKLGSVNTKRILRFSYDRVSRLDDPCSIGEALKGSKFGEFWKYGAGDYRVVSRIEDDRFIILVVKIGNRREVYR